MRLLLLTTEFPPGPGGIGTHAYQLAVNLRQLGWEVLVLSPQHYASDYEIECFNEVQPFRIVRLHRTRNRALKVLRHCFTITRLIKQWQPDLLLASGPRTAWLIATLTLIWRLPFVVVGHGVEFGVRRGWKRVFTSRAFGRAQAVICVSQYTWMQMLRLGVRPRHGRPITNGADACKFKVLPRGEVASFRQGLALPDASLILSVGNVSERKGQDIIIRALPHILKEAPNTHYLIAGLPSKKQEFMEIAKSLEVAGHVHFLGRVGDDDLPLLMNTCDVFAMTSRHTSDGDFEGFGIAVVEAALCAKPAVVAANSGLSEAIADGVTGFSVPEEDELATAEAILVLLKDGALRAKMGAAARERAMEQQTWSHCAQKYDSLLRCVLQPDGRPDPQGMAESSGASLP